MIYVFLADGFEEIEALAPVDFLRRAGVEVKLAGVTGKACTGAHGIKVEADISVDEIKLGSELLGVVLPGGFNFFTPVTNPQAATLPYTYQQNGENSPLDSISVLHAPNFWIGSYGSFQFMANTSVDTSAGTKGITSAQISSQARQSKFTHQNESPKAHEYSVTLNEGTAASGVTIEVTPTVHGAYVRFTFPEGSDNVNVIFDSLWGSGTLKFATDGFVFAFFSDFHNDF